MSELLKTPLNEVHKSMGGKMVPFAGWEMPVEYVGYGLRKEHEATRAAIGLFDVSHMGEIAVEGSQALEFLQKLLSNDVSKCQEGQAQYNVLLNEQGGVIDDLLIYCFQKSKKYLLVVNASNKDKDWQWVAQQSQAFDVNCADESAQWAQVAVQGPKAVDLVATLFPGAQDIKKFRFAVLNWQGQDWIVSRTGYTGEDGFEIYGLPAKVADLWQTLLQKGESMGAVPCGLGARNTLRIEAALPLYGNEFSEAKPPWGVGMDWAIKMQKEDFIGKHALNIGLAEGADSHVLVGLKALDKAVPRDGYRVLSFDKEHIGHVTSGTFSPSLDTPIAMALISKNYDLSQGCLIEIRQRLVETQTLTLPFVRKA